jgi:hypothetical protein
MPLSTVLGAQSVVKPGVCTTATRPASPFTGQMIYDTTVAQTLVWNGSAWIGAAGKIAQVVSTTKTDTYTMSSQTYTTVTGLTATITPTSATSKIYVVGSLSGVGDVGVTRGVAQIVRGSTALAVGDTAGSRVSATVQLPISLSGDVFSQTLTYLDSPASTSALVYGIQIRLNDAGATIYVNRSKADANAVSDARVVSTITVMEILA